MILVDPPSLLQLNGDNVCAKLHILARFSKKNNIICFKVRVHAVESEISQKSQDRKSKFVTDTSQ